MKNKCNEIINFLGKTEKNQWLWSWFYEKTLSLDSYFNPAIAEPKVWISALTLALFGSAVTSILVGFGMEKIISPLGNTVVNQILAPMLNLIINNYFFKNFFVKCEIV